MQTESRNIDSQKEIDRGGYKKTVRDRVKQPGRQKEICSILYMET